MTSLSQRSSVVIVAVVAVSCFLLLQQALNTYSTTPQAPVVDPMPALVALSDKVSAVLIAQQGTNELISTLVPKKVTPELVDKYLFLMEQTVMDAIYNWGKYLEDGSEWPKSKAFTMQGRKRLRNLREAVEHAIDEGIPGDIIETGVWRGGAMMFAQSILVAYGEVDKRNIYLCDSWTGIPPVNATEFPKDKVHEGADKFPLAVADGPEGVKEAFKRLGIWGTNIRLVQGWFKDTLHKLTEIEKIAVLRLDGDLYQSTWEALHALYPKLQVDGYLIIDDYLDWAGCKEAITDFRKKYGITDSIQEVKHDPGQTKRGAYWIKTATGGGSGFKPLYTV